MTQVLSPNDVAVRDFSRRVDVRFRIDDDVFHGKSGIPALTLMEFGAKMQGITEAQVAGDPDFFTRLISLVLDAPSAARFVERMSDDTNPITMEQLNDIMPWLAEQYGMRPTQPSLDSSTSSTSRDGGTSLTESGPTAVSTSAILTQTGS